MYDKEYMTKWRIANKDKVREYARKAYYKNHAENLEKKRRLAVDHEHKTGKVRGLLCEVCNRVVIGRIDSIDGYLGRILEYIK